MFFSCPGSSLLSNVLLSTYRLSQWVSQCHFRVWTHRVSFDPADPQTFGQSIMSKPKDKWQKGTKTKKTKRQGTKGQKESFILWCQGSYALLRCFLRAMFLCLNLCEGCVWGGHLHDKIWQIVLGDYMYDRSVPEYFSLVVDIGWTCQWPLHPSPVARHPEPMIH